MHKKIQNALVKFAEKNLYSKDIKIKDKCFLLFLFLMLIGTVAIIPPIFILGQFRMGVVFVVGLLLLLVEFILINKYRKYRVFEIATCFMFQLMIPPVFFMSGGLAGGALFFFIISIVFSYLVLESYVKVIHFIFCIVVVSVTVAISIAHPEYVAVSSAGTAMVANVVSCIVCCMVLIFVFSFQMHLHAEYEVQLRAKEEEAKQATVAKSMFLANMSHEIRTPMGVVIGLSEMIQGEDQIEAVHGMAKSINRTAGLLLNVINDILDFEKVSKGMMEIINAPYRIDAVIGDIKNVSEARCVSKGIALSIKKTPSVPDFVLGDETRFRQIATNIVNNAIKYTEKGFIDVILDYNTGNDKLILIVKDSGKGIKKEDLPYIFDSFQRSDVKNNRHIEGTGLGLAITKKLATAMGGSVSVISEYGKGSTFTVEVAHKKIDAPKLSESPERGTASDDVADIAGKKIFYVDDTKMNTIVFNGLLKGTGVDITFAFSGEEALDIIKDNTFDIIFLDYFMPGMDGVEVLNKMREMGVEIPIVVLTADAVNNAKERFLNEGFDDYLSKPIQKNKLISIIGKLG